MDLNNLSNLESRNSNFNSKENIMTRNQSLCVALRAALITLLGLFIFVATGVSKAGIYVPNPGLLSFLESTDISGFKAAEAKGGVSFDMAELLPEEQYLLEDLAGGGSFEVLAGWEVGSQPGQKASVIVIEDVDVTSQDGSTFTLYTVDGQGVQSSLDVVVEEDGVLAVYDPASDSVAYLNPVFSAPLNGTPALGDITDRARVGSPSATSKHAPPVLGGISVGNPGDSLMGTGDIKTLGGQQGQGLYQVTLSTQCDLVTSATGSEEADEYCKHLCQQIQKLEAQNPWARSFVEKATGASHTVSGTLAKLREEYRGMMCRNLDGATHIYEGLGFDTDWTEER